MKSTMSKVALLNILEAACEDVESMVAMRGARNTWFANIWNDQWGTIMQELVYSLEQHWSFIPDLAAYEAEMHQYYNEDGGYEEFELTWEERWQELTEELTKTSDGWVRCIAY